MTDELKPWKCKGGHVMGQVVRNGSGIRQLLLYRQAVELAPDPAPADVDVMAVVEGQVMDVKCSICGRLRTWVPGEEQLRKLMKDLGRELLTT